MFLFNLLKSATHFHYISQFICCLQNEMPIPNLETVSVVLSHSYLYCIK